MWMQSVVVYSLNHDTSMSFGHGSRGPPMKIDKSWSAKTLWGCCWEAGSTPVHRWSSETWAITENSYIWHHHRVPRPRISLHRYSHGGCTILLVREIKHWTSHIVSLKKTPWPQLHNESAQKYIAGSPSPPSPPGAPWNQHQCGRPLGIGNVEFVWRAERCPLFCWRCLIFARLRRNDVQ